MASALDAIFMPVAALFIVFFLVPAILLAPQNSADFATAVSVPNSRMVMQSVMLTYFLDEGGDETKNYKAISYRMSGSPSSHPIDRKAIHTYPVIISHLNIQYNSPYSGESFEDKIIENNKRERQDMYYNVRVPVRGGEVGNVVVHWQVY